MEVAAIILAIAGVLIGLVVAGYAMYLQNQTFTATIEHMRSISADVATFKGDMKELLGELRGMTERMTEAQERQFQMMLDAFVNRPAAAVEAADRASESVVGLQELSAKLESLEEQLTRPEDLAALKGELAELRAQLAGVERSAVAAARGLHSVERGRGQDIPYGRLNPRSIPSAYVRMLQYLAEHDEAQPNGVTYIELAERMNMPPSILRKRATALVESGWVEPAGRAGSEGLRITSLGLVALAERLSAGATSVPDGAGSSPSDI